MSEYQVKLTKAPFNYFTSCSAKNEVEVQLPTASKHECKETTPGAEQLTLHPAWFLLSCYVENFAVIVFS